MSRGRGAGEEEEKGRLEKPFACMRRWSGGRVQGRRAQGCAVDTTPVVALGRAQRVKRTCRQARVNVRP